MKEFNLSEKIEKLKKEMDALENQFIDKYGWKGKEQEAREMLLRGNVGGFGAYYSEKIVLLCAKLDAYEDAQEKFKEFIRIIKIDLMMTDKQKYRLDLIAGEELKGGKNKHGKKSN